MMFLFTAFIFFPVANNAIHRTFGKQVQLQRLKAPSPGNCIRLLMTRFKGNETFVTRVMFDGITRYSYLRVSLISPSDQKYDDSY